MLICKFSETEWSLQIFSDTNHQNNLWRHNLYWVWIGWVWMVPSLRDSWRTLYPAGSPVLLSWLCLIREAIKLAPSHRQQPGLFVTTSTAGAAPHYTCWLDWRYPDQLGTHLQAKIGRYHVWIWRQWNEGPSEGLKSRRRPLLGPSPGWKRLLPLSHLRHY